MTRTRERTALFGISVDSSLFGTVDVRAALVAGLGEYDRIVFLIADDLSIYNRVASVSADRQLALALGTDEKISNARVERIRWLERLRASLPTWPADQRWVVKSWSDFTDRRGFAVMRHVRILFEIDERFRADVLRCAADFARAHYRGGDGVIVERLAADYILEEIAINIRVRVTKSIADEFYMGTTFEMFRRVYSGEYSKSVEELAGVRHRKGGQPYRFFEWDNTAARWLDAEEASEDRVVSLEHAARYRTPRTRKDSSDSK